MQHRPIGDILLETTELTPQDLEDALRIQAEKGGRMGEILVRQGLVSEIDVLKALGVQFGLPVRANLLAPDLETSFAAEIPIQFLRKHRMTPVVTPEAALIAINDPLIFQPLDDLMLLPALQHASVVLSPYAAILSVINYAYDMSRDSAEQVIEDMHGEDTSQILSEILEPRAEELFSLVRDAVDRAGLSPESLASGAVITGGTSSMAGMTDLAEMVLGMPVRLGVPLGVGGLAEVVRNPRFCTGVGLVRFGAENPERLLANDESRADGGAWRRWGCGSWP